MLLICAIDFCLKTIAAIKLHIVSANVRLATNYTPYPVELGFTWLKGCQSIAIHEQFRATSSPYLCVFELW